LPLHVHVDGLRFKPAGGGVGVGLLPGGGVGVGQTGGGVDVGQVGGGVGVFTDDVGIVTSPAGP